MAQPRIEIDFHLDEAGALASMAGDVREGLGRRPRELPSKYFYDACGSELFERITQLPEYYLTRAEQRILERDAGEVARLAAPEELVELGPGSARKTRLLLDAARERGTLRRYVPLDVSRDMVRRSAMELVAEYPGLEVRAVVGDFERHLDRLPPGGRRLVAFLGSTLGNFLRPRAVGFLSRIAGILRDGDAFLLGTDLVKDKAVLEAAYNDSQGVTAEFNRNILRVVNRNLGGDFAPEVFDHVAFYDEAGERIEMHLRSRREQVVRIRALDLTLRIDRGEMIRTEVSCKYTRASVDGLLSEAGLVLERWFTDPEETFALSLSRPA